MKPGDLVTNMVFLDLYLDLESGELLGEVSKESIGIVMSPRDGLWVKWFVNGQIGWSNWTLLREVNHEAR